MIQSKEQNKYFIIKLTVTDKVCKKDLFSSYKRRVKSVISERQILNFGIAVLN